jgi:hypothetical protein
VEGRIQCNHLISNHFSELGFEIFENSGNPLDRSREAGTGYADTGRAHRGHPSLGVHIVEQSPQIVLGRLRTYPKALDGTTFPMCQNPPVRDN